MTIDGRQAGDAAPAHPETQIGPSISDVSDLDRTLAFYRDALGFELQGRLGDQAPFLSAGGYHHHIGLNTWEIRDRAAPAPGTTGLYHVAFLNPNRRELARAVRRLLDEGVAIDGTADHGVNEAVYFHGPDGNRVELTRDHSLGSRSRDKRGALVPMQEPLDLDGLLAEVEPRALADPSAATTYR